MSQTFELIGAALLALALAGSAYTVLAGFRVGALLVPPLDGARAEWPAVTVLKPLYGREPGLEHALRGLLEQNYPAPLQVIFGLQDEADLARPVVETLIRAYPDQDISLVMDARVHGTNRKISNLLNMAERARHEVIVLADSDISVGPDYLLRVVAALTGPVVGVATCAYYGEARAGVWSRLAAMGISYQFLPSLAVGVSLGMARPCMGSTIALRREALEEIGGFQAVSDVLADDYEIGRAVRATGRRSVVAPVLVAHGCAEASLRELVAHELRWARTIRGVDPIGFFGSGITHPFPLALVATGLLHAAPVALMTLAAAAICRLWAMRRVDEAAQTRSGVWWLLPLRDILSFAIFVASFFGRAVEWRGIRFRVDRRGGLLRT